MNSYDEISASLDVTFFIRKDRFIGNEIQFSFLKLVAWSSDAGWITKSVFWIWKGVFSCIK